MKSLDLCPGCMGRFIKWLDECKGKWIKSAEDEYDCSECGETVIKPSEECPFCGTKMIIEEAADDKK